MNPNQQPQMDPQAIALAQAIRKTESGDNFNAKGKSGEQGAYQWMPDTWKAHAGEVLGDPNADMTPSNQNAVAYTIIKKWKDDGLNPAQIAAKWNSGTEVDWENKVGVNKMGVKYDVPAYVKSVTDTYQQIKAGNLNAPQIPNPSTVEGPQAAPTAPENPNTGTLGTNPNDDFLGKLINNTVTRGIMSFFPGAKVGQAIGTLGGYALSPNKDTYDTSAPTPLQVGADVAQGALMVGTGMPEGVAGVSAFGKTLPVLQTAESALGRVGQMAAVGAGFGATGAIKEGSTNPGDIAENTALGAVIGGGTATLGEVVSALLQKVPEKIASATFKVPLGEIKKGIKTGEESFGKQIVDHGIVGTNKSIYLKAIDKVQQNEDALQSVLQAADAAEPALAKEGTQLGSISKAEVVPYFRDVVTKLQNTPGMKNDVKIVQGVFDDLPKSMTLSQANEMKRNIYQELGNPAYKLDANLSSKRQAMKTLGQALKDLIEKKTGAGSQTGSVVNHYNRELAFWGKLRDRALTNLAKGEHFGLKDIGYAGLGEVAAGHPGAIALEGVRKLGGTTIAKTTAAQALNVGGKALQTPLGKAVTYVAKTATKIGAGATSP